MFQVFYTTEDSARLYIVEFPNFTIASWFVDEICESHIKVIEATIKNNKDEVVSSINKARRN